MYLKLTICAKRQISDYEMLSDSRDGRSQQGNPPGRSWCMDEEEAGMNLCHNCLNTGRGNLLFCPCSAVLMLKTWVKLYPSSACQAVRALTGRCQGSRSMASSLLRAKTQADFLGAAAVVCLGRAVERGKWQLKCCFRLFPGFAGAWIWTQAEQMVLHSCKLLDVLFYCTLGQDRLTRAIVPALLYSPPPERGGWDCLARTLCIEVCI